MKKNLFLRSALWMLVLTVLASSLFLGGSTFAKYTSGATGTKNAPAAKFSVMVGKSSGTAVDIVKQTLTLNLFDTITEWGGTVGTPGTLQNNNAADAEVLQVAGVNTVIAPGTNGEVPIYVKNESDVAVQVKVTATIGDVLYDGGTTVPTNTCGFATVADIKDYVASRILISNANPSSTLSSGVDLAYKNGGTDSINPAVEIIQWEWSIGTGNDHTAWHADPTAIIAPDNLKDSWIGANADKLTIPFTLTLSAVQID